MNTSTVTSKGTITIPSQLRRSLGISAGDDVEIFLDETDQRLVVRKRMSLAKLRIANQTYTKGKKPVTNAGEYWLKDRQKNYGKS